jgi:hypothetical protein
MADNPRPKRRRSLRVLAERLLLGSIMSVIAVLVDRRLRRAFVKPGAASPPADHIPQEHQGEEPAHSAEQHADPSGDMPEARGEPAHKE